MDPQAFDSPEELIAYVRRISNELAQLDFEESADELQSWSVNTWTTSSELLGELGRSCQAALERDGEQLPPRLKKAIQRCLKEGRRAFAQPTR